MKMKSFLSLLMIDAMTTKKATAMKKMTSELSTLRTWTTNDAASDSNDGV